MSAPLSVTTTPNRDHVVVSPAGELDLATAPDVERQVRELRTAGFDHIVVDLAQTTFLDSSGLRLLLELRNDAKRRRQRLELGEGCREVQRVFELTATRGLFDWRDSGSSPATSPRRFLRVPAAKQPHPA